MSCDFSERVSLLIDGELPQAEAKQMRVHLTGCRSCRQVERDFVRLSQQIRSHQSEVNPIEQRQTLWRILASQDIPLWRRRVALPAPAFVIAVIAFVAVLALLVFSRGNGSGARVIERAGERGTSLSTEGSMDLSRFDRGERAMIYKSRRAQ